MKAQIQAKTRNRERGWAEYRYPDVKNGVQGPSRGMAGDALKLGKLGVNRRACVSLDPLQQY
jgi:hypothetical protein